jgi:hypothetical protein
LSKASLKFLISENNFSQFFASVMQKAVKVIPRFLKILNWSFQMRETAERCAKLQTIPLKTY